MAETLKHKKGVQLFWSLASQPPAIIVALCELLFFAESTSNLYLYRLLSLIAECGFWRDSGLNLA